MILVLSPHGDDAELGMGGTMATLARSHRVVHYVLTISGYTSTDGRLISEQQRTDEVANACRELGVELLLGSFKDNDLVSDISTIVGELDKMLEFWKPDEVYTCLPWFNEDHAVLYKATLAAMRKVQHDSSFYAYELPMQQLGYTMPEHGWTYAALDREAINKKVAALAAYKSQNLLDKDGPVSVKGALKLAELRGIECNAPFAERQLLLRGARLL